MSAAKFLMTAALAAMAAAPSQAQTFGGAGTRPGGQTAVCKDIPDSWPLRSRITGEHLKYIDTIKDKILIGGPVRGDAGAHGPVGSIIVYRTESIDEAKALLANDPFAKNKLFASCEWFDFSQYVGTYVGGWGPVKATN